MFKKASAIHRAAAVLTLGSALLVAQTDAAHAQAPEDNFRWRQMTITVAFSAGGNYDVYARLLSRHINRHLPGNPNVVVSNMPGAGGLKMANYMYNTALKDGSEIGVIPRALPTEPLLRKETNARFEPDKFNWIGSMNKEVAVLVFWQQPPVSLQDVLSGKEIPVGATGATSDGAMFSQTVNRLLGSRLKVIPAYPGVLETLLAMEKGEVSGTAAVTWASLQTNKPDWISGNKAKVALQMSIERAPELPDVPAIKELVKSERDRQVIDLIFSCQDLGRPFLAPPGLPARRVATLRQAFVASMNDPAMIAEAKKGQMDLNIITGEQAQEIMAKLVKTPEDVLQRAREIYAN